MGETAQRVQKLVQQAAQLLKAGRVDDAVALLRQAVHLNPHDFNAHHGLGVALARLGQLDEALIHLRQAIQINPRSPQAHFNLGRVHQRRGELQDALDAYGEAVRLKPDYEAAVKAVEEIQREISQHALEEAPVLETESLEEIEKALEHFRCHWHPDRTASTRCANCKRLVCVDCERFVFGVSMCFECAEKERAQAQPASAEEESSGDESERQ